MRNDIVAVLVEGQYWCSEHSDYDGTDIAAGHVVLIDEFDVLCGTDHAEGLKGACCLGCETSFGTIL